METWRLSSGGTPVTIRDAVRAGKPRRASLRNWSWAECEWRSRMVKGEDSPGGGVHVNWGTETRDSLAGAEETKAVCYHWSIESGIGSNHEGPQALFHQSWYCVLLVIGTHWPKLFAESFSSATSGFTFLDFFSVVAPTLSPYLDLSPLPLSKCQHIPGFSLLPVPHPSLYTFPWLSIPSLCWWI